MIEMGSTPADHHLGMHKHFRMVAISENLRNHGYTSAKDDHTRIPGIWEKLNGLYNLEALDERVRLSNALALF